MKLMNQCSTRMLLLVASLVMSGLASAACTQADLAGTWYAIGVGGDVNAGTFDEIDRCKVRVGSTGGVIATGSSCSFRGGSGTDTSNITGGSLALSSSCAVTGSIRFCNAYGCASIRIQYAQMERGKDAFAMAGYITSSPSDVGFLQVIKQ
ncbi:MAG: hypothetical protein HY941_01065 [Gammaproteobacteria bacterium]|nr:hypothetical protein [Gammaproteobacteria bacterium]